MCLNRPLRDVAGILRIRLGFYKIVDACRKPLSQALWACQLPFQGRFPQKIPILLRFYLFPELLSPTLPGVEFDWK